MSRWDFYDCEMYFRQLWIGVIVALLLSKADASLDQLHIVQMFCPDKIHQVWTNWNVALYHSGIQF